jgi:hypothetical protein
MANSFVPFLVGDPDINLRDYQHASRLYLQNKYELTPKPAWIYYIEININRDIRESIYNTKFLTDFDKWYKRYKGKIGLLAKTVDSPKFTVDTEVLNQYNRKTVIQKKINYSPIAISFHDDMANATTNLWKSYFQYYYGDSVSSNQGSSSSVKSIKYGNNKYSPYIDGSYDRYGLNNNQNIPFFSSIDIYQLYQRRFTSYKLVNPIIKEWSHDVLDQTQGNKLLTSRMNVEYETVIYNTSENNQVTEETPGFYNEHYDQNPSPLTVRPPPLENIGEARRRKDKLPPGPDSLYGKLDIPPPSALEGIQGLTVLYDYVRDISNLNESSLRDIGEGFLKSVLSGTPIDGSLNSEKLVDLSKRGLTQIKSTLGVTIPIGQNPTNNQIEAKPVKTKKPIKK